MLTVKREDEFGQYYVANKDDLEDGLQCLINDASIVMSHEEIAVVLIDYAQFLRAANPAVTSQAPRSKPFRSPNT